MKRGVGLALSCLLFLSALPSLAAEEVVATAKEENKVPWRGSAFIYENVFSAYSLNAGTELTYNPYYAQSFSFRPRYYPLDELSLALRLDVEIELTTADDTDHAREAVVSDLLFDIGYKHPLLTIPVVGVKFEPSLRITFPTSIVSRGRSLVMALGPGFALRREVPLLKRSFLSKLDLMYAFRASKYFHRYATAQVNVADTCSNPAREECQYAFSPNQHGMSQNRSWRLSNTIEAKLQILEKLSFAVDILFLNDLKHGLPEETVDIGGGSSVTLPASRINHSALVWAIFDLSYDLFDWLSLSVGTSTYYAQLSPDSSYRTPFFNRYTNFYFDVTIPVDKFVDQVQTWTGWGRRK